ncbi:MAG: hypothetical protein ACR2PG_13350 [Hyphomicrobiaceae bacterium]
MSNSDNSADLSMEEILASIRKIVSEEPEQSLADSRPSPSSDNHTAANVQPPARNLSDILDETKQRRLESAPGAPHQSPITWPQDDSSTSTKSPEIDHDGEPRSSPADRPEAIGRPAASRPSSDAFESVMRDGTIPMPSDRSAIPGRDLAPDDSSTSPAAHQSRPPSGSASSRQEPPFVNRLRELAAGYSQKDSISSDTKRSPTAFRPSNVPLRDDETGTLPPGVAHELDSLLPSSQSPGVAPPQGPTTAPSTLSSPPSPPQTGTEDRSKATLVSGQGDRSAVWRSGTPTGSAGLAARGTKPAFGVAAATGSAPVEVSIQRKKQQAEAGADTAPKIDDTTTIDKHNLATTETDTRRRDEIRRADDTNRPLTADARALEKHTESASSTLSSAERNEGDRTTGHKPIDVSTPKPHSSGVTETKLEAALIELVRPIVHDWLENNVPALIEKTIKASSQKKD